MNDHLYPSGYTGFTVFPKVFWGICFYFLFDDRPQEIILMFLVTSIQAWLTALHSEELLIEVYREEIKDDFHAIDYYTLIYLDLPYICKMLYYALSDLVGDLTSYLLGPRKAKND